MVVADTFMWPWSRLRVSQDINLINELTTRNAELMSLVAGQQATIARLEARVRTLEAQVKRLRPRPRPRT